MLKGLELEHEREVDRLRREIDSLRQRLGEGRLASKASERERMGDSPHFEASRRTPKGFEIQTSAQRARSDRSAHRAPTHAQRPADTQDIMIQQQGLEWSMDGNGMVPQDSRKQVKADLSQQRSRAGSSRPTSSIISTDSGLQSHESKDLSLHQQPVTPYEHLKHFLRGPKCDLIIGALVLANTIIMALDMQYVGLDDGWTIGFPTVSKPAAASWPSASGVFDAFEYIFTGIFALEIIVKFAVLRLEYVKHPINFLDVFVVTVSIIDLFQTSASDGMLNPMVLRLLRLIKLGRGIQLAKMSKAMDNLALLLKCLTASLTTLFWSMCLLLVIQCISAMLLSQFVRSYILDENKPIESRFRVYSYYGTFTRSMLTMFEISLANWAPACRLLVDNVSEWYSGYFIAYRCILGFAVLNVMSAVFVQQTMNIAARDQDIMLKRKEREQKDYTIKLKELFKRMDQSGDGFLSFEEFHLMLNRPEMKTWMSSLEIDPSDVDGLFQLLMVDGELEGEISFEQFLEGAGRLKGQARSVDMAKVVAHSKRIEQKLDQINRALSGLSVR